MGSEDLSENIINISNELDREIWGEFIHGYPGGWTRPLSRLARHSISGSNSDVNIIPGGYGIIH